MVNIQKITDLIFFNVEIVTVCFNEKLGYVKVGEAFEIKDVWENYLIVKSI